MKVLFLCPMADGLTGPAIKYGFEQLGHTVKAVDPRVQPLGEIFPAACDFKPDLVFCSREDVLVEQIRRIKQEMKVVVSMWNVDTRDNIRAWRSLFPLIEECDYYFVVDEGSISQWRKINQNTFWLPEGLQIETHDKPKNITKEDRMKYSCDVCWIGGRGGIHLVQSWRDVYLDAVEGMGVNLKQWGCSGNPQIRHGEHDKAVALSKINLALSACPQNGKYTSQRNYIILGAGGFLLERARDNRKALFEIFPRNTLDDFTSPQDLVEKIKYWLPQEEERSLCAERGYKWVRENATFKHRIRMALNYMGM